MQDKRVVAVGALCGARAGGAGAGGADAGGAGAGGAFGSMVMFSASPGDFFSAVRCSSNSRLHAAFSMAARSRASSSSTAAIIASEA